MLTNVELFVLIYIPVERALYLFSLHRKSPNSDNKGKQVERLRFFIMYLQMWSMTDYVFDDTGVGVLVFVVGVWRCLDVE